MVRHVSALPDCGSNLVVFLTDKIRRLVNDKCLTSLDRAYGLLSVIASMGC